MEEKMKNTINDVDNINIALIGSYNESIMFKESYRKSNINFIGVVPSPVVSDYLHGIKLHGYVLLESAVEHEDCSKYLSETLHLIKQRVI